MNNNTVTYADNSRAIHDSLALDSTQLPRESIEFLHQIVIDSWSASVNPRLLIEIFEHMAEQRRLSVSQDWFVTPYAVDVENVAGVVHPPGSQQEKNNAVIELLQGWMADESGYDEETWPVVKKALEENRLSYRGKFDG